MMKVKALFDAGHLAAAIGELNQEVKIHPTDVQRRLFLFELLSFTGDYERAGRQLDVISHQDPTVEPRVQVYRNILTAEKSRRRLFSEGLGPTFLFDPPVYVRLYLAAIDQLRAGSASEARRLLEEAEDMRPALSGRFNGQLFGDLADANPFFSSCFEIIVNDTYVWLPFVQIRRLQVPAPKTVLDLLWIAATLETHEGSVGNVFLPVLYAASHEHQDERVQLGRMTDWKTVGDELVLGAGHREFFVDEQEKGLLEMRELELDPGSVV